MFWALAIAILTCGALLLLGLRGRRVDDHPVCRRCRFDLTGVYPQVASCPECGSSLAASSAVRLGNRCRNRPAIILGSSLLVMLSAAGGLATWGVATAFDWNTIKPAWLLLREVRGDSGGAAREELLKRAGQDRLPPGLRKTLIDRALEVHGDPEANWDSAWATFLEDQWAAGLLTSAQIARYARQAVRTTATIRPSQARQGATAGVVISVQPHRTIRSADVLHVHGSRASAALGSDPPADQTRGGRTSGRLGVHSGFGMAYTLSIPENLLGPQPVKASMHLSVLLNDPDGTPIVEWTDVHDLQIEIVPADTQLVSLVTDPEVDEAVHSAIRIIST
jgi:hypothetical protein